MSLPFKIAFWATVAGQIILLLAFIAVKENTLRTGTSVLLQTVPIDPRSLLQGDFVILDYVIAGLPPPIAADSRPGEEFFVELFEGANGVWQAGRYSRAKPDSSKVFIKGTVNSRRRLDLGIGTYFIPEGTGHIIERAVDVKVQVAVSSGGSAVIVELLVDGEPFDPRRPPERSPERPPNEIPPPRERPPDRSPQPVR